MSFRATLFSNQNAAGNGAAFDWPGGPGAFIGEGTLTGATLKLQVETPSGGWLDVLGAFGAAAPAALAALPAQYSFHATPGRIRAVLTGGTPTSINAWAVSLS
jgi:hypothetical protein